MRVIQRIALCFILLICSASLTVAQSPGPTISQDGAILQSSATSTVNGTAINVGGFAVITYQVTALSGTATIVPEASLNGNHYNALTCFALDGVTTVTSFTTTGTWRCTVTGNTFARARISSCTGCTVSVQATKWVSGPVNTATSPTIRTYAKSALPASAPTGTLALVSDSVRGLWVYYANQWLGMNFEWVNVKWFGAKGDGVTDDSVAIQAAINAIPANVVSASGGGHIEFPIGVYTFGTQLTVSGSDKRIIFEGAGSNGVVTLVWTGANTVAGAIKVSDVSGYIFRNFNLNQSLNPAGLTVAQRGSAQGFLLTGTSAGSSGGSATFDHVSANGWDVGIAVGDNNSHAQSEILYTHVTLSYNNTGWENYSSNSLDHVFDMLEGVGNGTLVYAAGGDNVYVHSGSATQSTVADFHFPGAGVFAVSDFRSEGPSSGLSGITAALAGAGAGNVDNGYHNWKVVYVISGVDTPGPQSNALQIVNKAVNGQVTLTVPVGPSGTTARKIYRSKIAGGSNRWWLLTTINDNSTTSSTDNTADSGLGVELTAGSGTGRNFVRFASTSGISIVTIKGCRVAGNEDTSVNLLLGVGGKFQVTVIGNQLMGLIFPNMGSGNASLTLIDNSVWTDSMNQPYGTFTAPAGAIFDPNFSGHLTYVSMGNMQISSTGGFLLSFNNEQGAVFSSAIVPLQRFTENQSSSDQDFRMVSGLSGTSTQAKNLRGTCTFAGAGTCTVTFGTAEINGTYNIFTSPTIDERFWITSPTANGFTINSSNAGSTATVPWLLVR